MWNDPWTPIICGWEIGVESFLLTSHEAKEDNKEVGCLKRQRRGPLDTEGQGGNWGSSNRTALSRTRDPTREGPGVPSVCYLTPLHPLSEKECSLQWFYPVGGKETSDLPHSKLSKTLSPAGPEIGTREYHPWWWSWQQVPLLQRLSWCHHLVTQGSKLLKDRQWEGDTGSMATRWEATVHGAHRHSSSPSRHMVRSHCLPRFKLPTATWCSGQWEAQGKDTSLLWGPPGITAEPTTLAPSAWGWPTCLRLPQASVRGPPGADPWMIWGKRQLTGHGVHWAWLDFRFF